MSLQQLAPRAARIAGGLVLGAALVGALVCSEIVRQFTKPHAPKGAPR